MKLLLALLFKGEEQKERRLRNKYLDEGEENPQGILVSNNCFAVQIKKVYYLSLFQKGTSRTKSVTFPWLSAAHSLLCV